jgi:carbon monoxide dehydrogenase subunit G
MVINSNKVNVAASTTEVFDFLIDMNNIIHLLPQDKISDFKSTDKDCSFKVQGGVVISLELESSEQGKEIKMKSGANSPFPFNLTIHLSEEGEGTEGYLHFNGEVNMFLKMMVEKPLTNLFNYMSDKIKAHFEG